MNRHNRGAEMKKQFRLIVAIATCFALGACSSIGTVNGVNIDQGRMGVQNAPKSTLCDANPWICVMLAAGTVGGILAIMALRGNNGSNGYHHPGPV